VSKRKPPRNVIVVSDIHAGCKLGLCHDEGVPLDDGGYYKPSRLQKQVYQWWLEFWNDWVPMVTHGEPWDFVFNGDAIDGVHHGSTTQISHNVQDQVDLACKLLDPWVAACRQSGGEYYHIRGTEAHVGKSGNLEEQLAKRLDAKANSEGQRARWELWKKVGTDGLAHFLHHIGTTASAAHESSAVNAELSSLYNEAGRWRNTPPDVVCRSHRHRCIEVRLPNRRGFATSVVTPAWQLKTPFTWKIAGARISMPQIGGILIRQGDNDIYTRCKVWDIERSKPE